MVQSRVIVTERAGVDLIDEYVESDPTIDELLVLGVVTTSPNLTFEDGTNGSVTLTDALRDENVVVSSNDTTPGDLITKLVAGAGVTLTENNDGGNETLTVAAVGVGTDELVGVTSNDTTPGYLLDKIIGTTNKITITEVNDGGDEDLQINVGTDIFDKAVDDTDDITEGTTNLFFTDERVDDRVAALIVGGTNLTATYNDGLNTLTLDVDAAADTKEVQVSANDTTPGFLLAKLVAGANITLTELGDGGNETLSIAAATPVDERVRVSANDATTDFLINKITGGTAIDVTEINDGGTETLDIDVNISGEATITPAAADLILFHDDSGGVIGQNSISAVVSAAFGSGGSWSTIQGDTGTATAVGLSDTLNLQGSTTSGTRTVATAGSPDNVVVIVAPEQTTAATTLENDDIFMFHDDSETAPNTLRGITYANILTELAADLTGTSDELVGVSANDTTPGYLLDKITSTGSSITITEVNDGGDEDLNLEVNEANVDHDALQNFVANEHIDHSGVSVLRTTFPGLTVTNDDLTSNIEARLDISTLELDTTLVGTDEVAFDDGTANNRRISITNFGAQISSFVSLAIDDLTDVDTSTTAPVTDDLLEWDGSNFIPVAPEDIEQLNTWSETGSVNNVNANGIDPVHWAIPQSTAGITMPVDGEIIRMSVSMESARTAGSFFFAMTINSVAQSGAGQTVTIDATNTLSNSLVLATPIQFSAGDVISGIVNATGFSPTSAEANCTFWYRDR